MDNDDENRRSLRQDPSYSEHETLPYSIFQVTRATTLLYH